MDFQPHHRAPSNIVSNRKFGRTVGGILIVLGLLPLLKDHPRNLPLVGTGAALVFIGSIFPAALGPLNMLWMRLGDLLHRIVSPLMLGLVFFAVVTPIGLIKRLFDGEPLQLRYRHDLPSYWRQRPQQVDAPESMRNQF